MNRNQQGSGTIMVAAAALVLVMVALVVGWAIAWFGCIQRANATADLVASAAAQAKAGGHEPCRSAQQVATTNRVRLDSCVVHGNETAFDVTVQVSVPLIPKMPIGPDRVAGRSTAGTV